MSWSDGECHSLKSRTIDHHVEAALSKLGIRASWQLTSELLGSTRWRPPLNRSTESVCSDGRGDLDTQMKLGPDGLWQACLKKAQVEIRALFWPNPLKNFDTRPIAKFLNDLPNGARDPRSQTAVPHARLCATEIRGGVHHQKLLEVMGLPVPSPLPEGWTLTQIAWMREVSHRSTTCNCGSSDQHPFTSWTCSGREGWIIRNQRNWTKPTFKKSASQVSSDFSATAATVKSSTPNLPTSTGSAGVGTTATMQSPSAVRTPIYRSSTAATITRSIRFSEPAKNKRVGRLFKVRFAGRNSSIYIEGRYFVSRRLKAELLKKLRIPELPVLTSSRWKIQKHLREAFRSPTRGATSKSR